MHRIFIAVIITATCLTMAGCGGGGGSSTPVTPTSAAIGTWTVSSINLPQDQLFIGSGGEVFVKGETPVYHTTSTRATNDYYTRIGTCNLVSGNITFSGSWTYGGLLYRMSGSGSISAATHSISVLVTVMRESVIILPDKTATGSRTSDTPPAVPDFPTGGGTGYDTPPPVPI